MPYAETFATGAVETHRFRVGAPIEQIVAGLNEVAGDNLATYPSMLARLVGEARSGRLTIEPRRILTMAEPLLPEIRKAAEETWSAPVANMWGTSEGGVTAIGCFQGPGMHLTDDLLIVEPVDEHGDPVPAGVRSHKIYLTNLFNPLMPLIRYEITDEITLDDEPCAVRIEPPAHPGHPRPQRRHLPLWSSVSIHPHLFRSILAKHSSDQRVPDPSKPPTGAQITICATAPVDTDSIASEIASALGDPGSSSPRSWSSPPRSIPRLETGKLKRFIPREVENPPSR